MIIIYYTSSENQLSDAVFSEYLGLFPAEIRNRILKFKRWQDAQAALLGKLLLKKGLDKLCPGYDLSQVKYTAYGRPYLENAPDFNISHSAHYIVCAFSTNGNIGIDIEQVKPVPVDDFINVFSVEEWADIVGSENVHRTFFYYWTAKESILKAEGSGLHIPLKDILIKNGMCSYGQTIWYYKNISLFNDCVLQIASDKNLEDINLVELMF